MVLAVAGPQAPRWHDAPLYVAALAAQFGVDFGVSATWSRVGYGIPAREHLVSMRESAFVDVALAPVGLVVAVATIGKSWGVVLVLPLVLLHKVFAQERQRRLDHALELSQAYRGTAMLLGEVIEADDEYTGSHSRDVVELVVAVAERLGLESRAEQHAEFAALLHDVGKVKMPSELINKPGPLDQAERALMQTHTIVGEEMLDKIGGLLGEVGHIVRSCHEHWDGRGYPDGLAGERIPLAARIISACDALERDDDRPLLPPGAEKRRSRGRAAARARARSSTPRSSTRSKPSSPADLQPERLRERRMLRELGAQPRDVTRAERHRPAARRRRRSCTRTGRGAPRSASRAAARATRTAARRPAA